MSDSVSSGSGFTSDSGVTSLSVHDRHCRGVDVELEALVPLGAMDLVAAALNR